MKKALIVTTVGGFVPKFEMNNVYLLQSLGYEVHYASNFEYLVYQDSTNTLKDTKVICHSIKFVRSPFQLNQNIKAYCQLYQLLKKEKFFLVHCHTPMGGFLTRIATWQYRIKNKEKIQVLYTAHGFHFYRGAPLFNWLFFYPIERCLALLTDRLITINLEDYHRAKSFRLKKGGELCYVPGVGVDIKELQNRVSRTERQKALRQKFSHLLFYAGELNEGKNVKTLIKALAKMKQSDCALLICGEGPEKKRLKQLAGKYGIRKRVIFAGYRLDVPELMKCCDIFLFASKREGRSVAVMEAMACSLPAIVSKIRGNSELIVQGKGGFLIRPDDAEGFAKAADYLLSQKKRCKEMGQFNANRVKEFGIEKISEQMKKIYQGVTG